MKTIDYRKGYEDAMRIYCKPEELKDELEEKHHQWYKDDKRASEIMQHIYKGLMKR